MNWKYELPLTSWDHERRSTVSRKISRILKLRRITEYPIHQSRIVRRFAVGRFRALQAGLRDMLLPRHKPVWEELL